MMGSGTALTMQKTAPRSTSFCDRDTEHQRLQKSKILIKISPHFLSIFVWSLPWKIGLDGERKIRIERAILGNNLITTRNLIETLLGMAICLTSTRSNMNYVLSTVTIILKIMLILIEKCQNFVQQKTSKNT